MLSKMPRKLKWLLIIPLIIAGFFIVMGINFSGPLTEKEKNNQFIVVNPLDLTQIKGFSKYRSCAGHDYRDPTLSGVKEPTPRSMKHYIKVKDEFRGKNDVIKAIAPFNGKISNIEKNDPERKPYDQQIWLTPNSNSTNPRQWHFIFFHIELKEDLQEGSQVKAGEVIGTAYLTRGPENSTDNFDMAVKFTRPMQVPAVDLPLAHATNEVMAEYEKYDIKLSDMVISEQYRDENLCPTTGESLMGDVFFTSDSNPNDFVFLKKP